MSDSINRKLERLVQRRDEIEAEIYRLRHLPQEPAGDNIVITFTKRFGSTGFGSTGSGYVYAAVKADGRWWVTGAQPTIDRSGRTWDQLVDFINSRETTLPEIIMATDWTPLT